MDIYLYVNEKVEGPYTQDQLFHEVRKRSLPMSTLAKEEGSEEWVEILQFFSRSENPKSQSPSLVSVSKPTAVTTPEVAAKPDNKGNLSVETPTTQIKNVETLFVVFVHFVFGVLLFGEKFLISAALTFTAIKTIAANNPDFKKTFFIFNFFLTIDNFNF